MYGVPWHRLTKLIYDYGDEDWYCYLGPRASSGHGCSLSHRVRTVLSSDLLGLIVKAVLVNSECM